MIVVAFLLAYSAQSVGKTYNVLSKVEWWALSGVCREMRFAVPLQAVAGIFGVVLWTIGRLI